MMRRTAVWWTATGLALVMGVGGAGWAQAQAPAATSNGRVAIVDIQRILARSVAGAAAREQLEKDKAAMQRQLDGQKTELERMRDELEKKGQLLSADARREKQETLERKVRDVRRLVDDLQKELQKKEQEILAKVLNDVSGVVQKVGKEKGYFMIVERRNAGVIYAAAEADVTDEVIRAFDDEARKGKK
jgi:outer membrane protein